MIALHPSEVRISQAGGGSSAALEDVSAIAIDRVAERLALEWTDLGPHVAFVDAPEVRVSVRLWRSPREDEADAEALLRPGSLLNVSFRAARGASDAGARRVFVSAVVTEARHEVGRRGVTQRVTMVAISSAGTDDPVQVVEEVV